MVFFINVIMSHPEKIDFATQELLRIFSENLRDNSKAKFDNFADSVFIVDLLGRFVYVNPAFEKLLGYGSCEILGRHFRMLFTLDDLNEGFLFFYQTLRGCYAENSRFRIFRKDRSTRVIDVLASPIMFQNKVRAGIAIAHDVTGQQSDVRGEQDRVELFKRFSQDLESWKQGLTKIPAKSQNPHQEIDN